MTVGVFDHEDRARQLIRFDGMNIKKRSFTDFDAVMEWRNVGWLAFEVKQVGKDVPTGQRIALERLVRDTTIAGKYAVAAVVEHNVFDPHEDIYLRKCLVRSLFISNEYRWRPPKRRMNAHELMIDFIGVVDKAANGDGLSGPSHFC